MNNLRGRSLTVSTFGILISIFAIEGAALGQQIFAKRKANAFFAFGDSYADAGNRELTASAFNKPYGVSWPGIPTGRFSDGHVSTDYLAYRVLRLPTPTAFAKSNVRTTEYGINFAIGGSAVTYAYGFLPIGAQVNQFEEFLRAGHYSRDFLERSVAYVSIVGNDYSVGNLSPTGLETLIPQVIEGIAVSVKRLYDLGFRNFIVANIVPTNCLPSITARNNFTACEEGLTPLINAHNQALLQVVTQLQQLPSANIVILDQFNSYSELLGNSTTYGFTEKFAPCCRPKNLTHGSCGDVDEQGKPLYTVCADPSNHLVWDSVHPTQKSWMELVKLYHQTGYVIGAPNLQTWAQPLLNRTILPAPMTGPATGFLGQLEAAFTALLSEPDFLMVTGLLRAVNWTKYFENVTEQQVTAFLGTNEAFRKLPGSTLPHFYESGNTLLLVTHNTVIGFHDSTQLWESIGQNLTTVSGFELPVSSNSSYLVVGPERAQIVRPDLYRTDKLVVHGVDTVMIPPI